MENIRLLLKFPFPTRYEVKNSSGCLSCLRATLRQVTSSSREVSLSCWARVVSPSSRSIAGRPSRPCARPYSRPATARSQASSRLESVLFYQSVRDRVGPDPNTHCIMHIDLKMSKKQMIFMTQDT